VKLRGDYTIQSDEDLMVLSTKGDTNAFGELYDRYAKRMILYFSKMLWNDREKAADFTQDLFTKIIKNPGLFKEGRKFSTWVYSIANNMCKNEYRSHEVRTRHAPGIKDTYTLNQSNYFDKADKGTFKESLDQELAKLEPLKRSTFIMRYKHDLSIREIADVMNCSEGTVKSRLFYSLKKLSVGLKQFDPKDH